MSTARRSTCPHCGDSWVTYQPYAWFNQPCDRCEPVFEAGRLAERARWYEVARAFWRRETFEAFAKASEDLRTAERCLARDESDAETRAWRDELLRQWHALNAACEPLRGKP